MHAQQGEIITLREQARAIALRLDACEDEAKTIRTLRHQALVLRWMLGLGTTVAAAALVRAL